MVIVILAAFHARDFLGTLAIGIHAGTGYEDCSPEFLLHMRQMMKTVSAGRIEIEAPLLDWLKHGIFDEAHRLNVRLKLTYSWYASALPPGGNARPVWIDKLTVGSERRTRSPRCSKTGCHDIDKRQTRQAPGASSDPGPEGGHEIPVAMPTYEDRSVAC
jgi:hypothetical protein